MWNVKYVCYDLLKIIFHGSLASRVVEDLENMQQYKQTATLQLSCGECQIIV